MRERIVKATTEGRLGRRTMVLLECVGIAVEINGRIKEGLIESFGRELNDRVEEGKGEAKGEWREETLWEGEVEQRGTTNKQN